MIYRVSSGQGPTECELGITKFAGIELGVDKAGKLSYNNSRITGGVPYVY